MAVKISNNVISITRGDSLRTTITIFTDDGNEYTPEDGDVVTFGLKKTINDEECLIEKVIPHDTMELYLSADETKALEYGEYLYDVQIKFAIGDVYTFITYTKFKVTGEVV